MGEFPSGQRGQTVNLLALPSVVRIHFPPLFVKSPFVLFLVTEFGTVSADFVFSLLSGSYQKDFNGKEKDESLKSVSVFIIAG